MKTVAGQNDFACMAETVRRRYARLLSEAREETNAPADPGKEFSESEDRGFGVKDSQTGVRATDNAARSKDRERDFPDLILIDGGKGQLNSACAELTKLGLDQIAIIGLAKEFEEIFQPGEMEPLILSRGSGALKLLQRVRDESHRFANTYNAKLRLRKISESLLDEFPGIGNQRKAALLKRFGSVQRLRLATVEQIAEVCGFGGKAAAELKTFIEARSFQRISPAPSQEAAEQ
jgi:excinuclease ABC subunit C